MDQTSPPITQTTTEDSYRIIFEVSPDAIAVHDRKTLLLINPAGVKMLGAASAAEVIGKPILEFIHADDHAAVTARFALEAQGQSVPMVAEKMIRVDGSILDVEIAGTPYQYQGKPASLVFIRDISKRQQADAALRQSEAELRQAQHFSRMGSWTWDIKTDQLDFSDEMYTIFGLDRDTFSGSLADVIAQTTHPDDLEKVAKSNLAALAGNTDIPLEYRIVWKDGSVHIIHSEAGEVIFGEAGKPIFMRGIAQDITERKTAELSLRKSESRLHQAAQLARLGIWDWDVTTDQVEWSGDMFRIYGISPEEFTGKGSDYFNFTRADYREIQQINIAKAFEQGVTEVDLMAGKGINTEPKELCIVRRDGTECYTLGDAVCIVDENGKPLRMLGITQDITERKEAETKRRESEENYQRLFDNAILGVFQSTVDGKVLSANQAFAEMFGYTSPTEVVESIGNVASDFFVDPARRAEMIRLMTENPDLRTFENMYRRKDGSIFIGNLHTTPIRDANNRLIGIEGIVEDITERRETEKKLRESEERFRSLSQATFEGIVIHDHGIIQDANQSFANLFGYANPDDLIGKNSADVLSLAPESEERVKVHMATGSTEPVEATFLRPDGTFLMVEAQGRPFNIKGRMLRVVTIRDVTKRKHAENMQARLTAILEAMPDFVSTADLSQHITYINRAGRKMVGIGEYEDISGMEIGELSPAWANEIITNVGIPAAIQHGVWRGETARLTRDGREIPVAQVILAHKQPDGTLEYLSTICRDITESRQAEEKIRRQLDHLTALSEIDRAITSNFDMSESLKTLLLHVTRQLNVDAADAMLYDEGTQTLQHLAGTGFRSKNIKNFSMGSNEGYAGRVISERRMIKVTNLSEKPEDYVRATFLADDAFVSYFGVPLIAKDEVKGVLEVFNRTPLQPDDEWLGFLGALAEQAAIAIDNAILFSDLHSSKVQLEQAYDTTLDGWSKALDLRDKETEGHTRRVTELTLRMAHKMGFSEEALVQIKRGGLLHDIGKMGIPDSILLKPGALTQEEWAVMRKHTTYAYEMLSPIEYLHPALDIPYCHHEHWDGSGYPRGLKGDEIPLVARIFSVVDVWDALRSDRPYRKAWEKEKVREYILSLTGKQFDPAVVAMFLEEMGLA